MRAWARDPLALIALALITGTGLWVLAVSLEWGVRNDLPLLMYAGRLAVSGARAPFRDVFDMNQPFALLAYGVLDALVGPNDRVLRLVDVALVVLIGWIAGDALGAPRRRIVGMAAAALFAVWHVHDAGVDALQREMLVLVLLALAGLALRHERWATAGALMGFSVLVKVHSAPFFAVIWLLHVRSRPPRSLGLALGRFVGGAALGVAAVLAWVAACGGLGGWWWLLTEYVPLYGSQAGTLTFEADSAVRWERIWGWATDLRVHPATWFAPVALWLVVRTRPRTESRRAALAVAALWAWGWLYVVVAGVFWLYHETPAMFFGAFLVALVLAMPREQSRAGWLELHAARAGALYLAWSALAWPLADLDAQRRNDGRNPDAVRAATYLGVVVDPGQTVQPLDVVTGAVDGMWRAHVPLATPILYDFMLYHHVDTPVVSTMRRRFLDDLTGAHPPDWIVRPRPHRRMRTAGPLSTSTFPELEAVLTRDYRVAHDDGVLVYYVRREPSDAH